jgi:threonine/homoserine/homoserine lactone efflux protein
VDAAPFLAGLALGVSLAAPPGPVTALMAQEVARRGASAGARVGLGATTADGCFFLLALAGAIAVLASQPVVLGALSLAGMALLLFYARSAWRSARQPLQVPRAGPAGFRTGFLAAATSPFNLAWWVGPGSVLIASAGLLLAAGLFAGILAWIALFALGLERLGRRVPRFQEAVAYASAAVLAAFAAWIAWRGAQLLGWL